MKTFTSRSRGALTPAIVLTSICWLIPANSFAQPAKAQSKFYLGADISSLAGSPVQIIMHIDCGGDWPVTKWWFDHIGDARLDYDIIGQSFYPRWHGTPALLQQNILESSRRYGKPVMVVEAGYPQSGGEQIKAGNKYNLWPGTQEGQLQFMVDLVNTVKRAGGTGVSYWAPEGSRGNGMWNADGSPAPSVFVLANLSKLMNSPDSR
jgi:arabinogalactan endo-1,4-beta-galactosidase